MRGKWGRAALARDEQMAINATLTDRLAQLKLENDTLDKAIDTLKGKQPITNGPIKETKKKSPTQKFIDGSESEQDSPSEQSISSEGEYERSRTKEKKRKTSRGGSTSTWSPTRGSRRKARGPAGLTRDKRHRLAKMDDFSGKITDGETFLRSFEVRAANATDEEKCQWFKQFCGAKCPEFANNGHGMKTWEKCREAFIGKYTIQTRPRDILRRAEEMVQAEDEHIAAYILRVKEALKNLDIEDNYEMAVDALYSGMRPMIKLGSTSIRAQQMPWTDLTNQLIKLEYSLGGPEKVVNRATGHANLANEGRKEGSKRKRGLSKAQLEELRRLMPHPEAKGCWLCGKDDHRAYKCHLRPEFDLQNPQFALTGTGKGKQE